jgi:hypothetical protein
MSRGVSVREGQLVARSLKVTRSTHLLVAAVTAAVAANASVAIQLIPFAAQLALAAVVFASLATVIWALSSEIFSRSGQTITNLRSIGATGASLSKALLVPVLVYGAAGAALGAGAGAAIGISIGGPGAATALAEALAIIATSAAASAVGTYAGGRAAWHR